MASVWKHPKSKYWTACFTDEDGRQVKRSTKQTNRKEALTVAIGYEYAVELARRRLLTESKTREVLNSILEKTSGEIIRHFTVKEYLDAWVKSKELVKSPGTAERYKHTVELFITHLGDRAKRPLVAVTARDVQSFVDSRIDAGIASKTVSVDAKTLGSAFGRAARQGLITINPVGAVELPNVVSSRRDVFAPAQVTDLMNAAKGTEWETAIYLGYFTGARLSDCVAMKWENVNFTDSVIQYEPRKTSGTTKGHNCILVPMHPALEAHLSKLASTDKPEEFLCPGLFDRPTGGAHGLSRAFKDIMVKADVDCQSGQGKGTRQFSKLSFHSLRHSFNSALANAGVSQELRMKLTGHKTVAMNTKYTHHDLAALKEAVGKLPPLSNGKATS